MYRAPKIDEVRERVLADVEAETGLGPTPRRSMVRALSGAMAGVGTAGYGFVEWAIKQIFPDTAELENLERHASLRNISRKPATYASGQIEIKGTQGAFVTVGTAFQIQGQRYLCTEAGTIGQDGTGTCTVEAEQAGAAGDRGAQEQLQILQPITGILQTAIVLAPGIAGGVDPEADEALRGRLLDRMQTPPRGGSQADYVAWALEVPGVTKAWCMPNHVGVGTVGLAFLFDGGVPDQTAIDAVTAHVEGLMPIGAQLVAFAPAILLVDFTILLVPDSAGLRQEVEASLVDLLERTGDPGSTLLLSHIREAISTTTGERDHILQVPAADVVMGAGEIPRLGVITWS